MFLHEQKQPVSTSFAPSTAMFHSNQSNVPQMCEISVSLLNNKPIFSWILQYSIELKISLLNPEDYMYFSHPGY